jgi:hypothetical protein
MTTIVSIWLALVLAVAGGLKAWRAEQAGAGLATFGIETVAAQRAGIGVLIAAELGLSVALAGGAGWAPGAAAGLLAVFALATLGAMWRAGAGARVPALAARAGSAGSHRCARVCSRSWRPCSRSAGSRMRPRAMTAG